MVRKSFLEAPNRGYAAGEEGSICGQWSQPPPALQGFQVAEVYTFYFSDTDGFLDTCMGVLSALCHAQSTMILPSNGAH
jgi:hypothetical protein